MSAAFPASVVTDAQLGVAANAAQTTLNGTINNAVTTITVVDTTSFSASGFIVIDTEIIQYTGKTGTTFTGCTRGADSSAAASHTTGVTIYGYIVAAHLTNVQAEIKAIETLVGTNSQDLDLSGRAGFGLKLVSPDGTKTFRLYVDNNGELTVVELT